MLLTNASFNQVSALLEVKIAFVVRCYGTLALYETYLLGK